jgi:NitT/TauT family transport system substrate-binding protein
MADALRAGQVDAVAVWHPFLHQSEKMLGGAGISFSGESTYTYTFNVAASRLLVNSDRQAVECFLRALKKAESYARQRPEQSQEIVSSATGLDRASLKELWGGFDFRLSLDQTLLLGMESEARWAIREKLVENRALPNFLDFIYFDGLEAVYPEAVLITH